MDSKNRFLLSASIMTVSGLALGVLLQMTLQPKSWQDFVGCGAIAVSAGILVNYAVEESFN